MREGSALLQGLASCGHCGRRLRTHYTRPHLVARLSLLWRASRRGARQLLPQHRWRADRRGCDARVHCRARAGEDRSNAGRRRAARERPRGRAQAMAARRRAGELCGQALPSAAIVLSIPTTGLSRVASNARGRRASVRSRRRRRSLHVARVSGRACSRARSAAVCGTLGPDLADGLDGGHDHAARQEGAAWHADRGGDRQGRARQVRGPSHAALERRRTDRDRLGPAAQAPSHGAHGRGHGRARAPTGRALSRHRDRRHPQPTGPKNSARPPLRGQPRRPSLRTLLEHPMLRPEGRRPPTASC